VNLQNYKVLYLIVFYLSSSPREPKIHIINFKSTYKTLLVILFYILPLTHVQVQHVMHYMYIF